MRGGSPGELPVDAGQEEAVEAGGVALEGGVRCCEARCCWWWWWWLWWRWWYRRWWW
jgi:hypothetical protein